MNPHQIGESPCHFLIVRQQRRQQGSRLMGGGNLPGEMIRGEPLQRGPQLAHGGNGTHASGTQTGIEKLGEIRRL